MGTKSETSRPDVVRAAEEVMHNIESLTPSKIVEAAPDDREEEARDAARRLEDAYMEIDDMMFEIQSVVKDD